jgi:hypothetical protein
LKLWCRNCSRIGSGGNPLVWYGTTHWDSDIPASITLDVHYAPKNLRDRIAYGFIQFLRFCADLFFFKRYSHRAVVLETVAAVPGMVGGAFQHFRSLRRMKSDHGWSFRVFSTTFTFCFT